MLLKVSSPNISPRHHTGAVRFADMSHFSTVKTLYIHPTVGPLTGQTNFVIVIFFINGG